MRISSPAILPVGIKAKKSNNNASISVLLTYNSEPSGPGIANPKKGKGGDATKNRRRRKKPDRAANLEKSPSIRNNPENIRP